MVVAVAGHTSTLRAGANTLSELAHRNPGDGTVHPSSVGHMSEIACPRCGEQESLLGRTEGPSGEETITVTCGSCDLEWERDLTHRCPTCGSDAVRPALQSIVEKSRGTQLSIQSLRVVHLCPDCDTEQLAIWNRSNTPLRPAELPHDVD